MEGLALGMNADSCFSMSAFAYCGDPYDTCAQIVPNFRVRTIPVLGTTPALFGMAAASYILCQLAGSPWEGEPLARPLSKEYERLLKELRDREIENFGDKCPPCPLDLDDVSAPVATTTILQVAEQDAGKIRQPACCAQASCRSQHRGTARDQSVQLPDNRFHIDGALLYLCR